jgi:hypothetical protein
VITTFTQKPLLSCSNSRARPVATIKDGKVTRIQPLIDGELPKAPLESVINDGKTRETAIVDQRPQLPIPADEENPGLKRTKQVSR